MYVPGSDLRKLEKIPKLGADCICLDCEDGVAWNQKVKARNNIRDILDGKINIEFGKSERSVRVNSVVSEICKDDLEVVLSAKSLPNAFHLPKVDSVDDLKWFTDQYMKLRKDSSPVGLIMFIESARAMLSLKEICQTAVELSEKSNVIPEALVFGSDDFVADIGATRTKEATELMYARQKLVTVAKAFQMQVCNKSICFIII